MSRANILAQIANPQGGENVMRAYQQGTQMRYMQDERDRMQRKENALFSMAPMIESGDFKGAAAAAARGGDPHLSQGFITLAQKQERENAFRNLLNPGGGGAGGFPPASDGEPMPIVRPSMVAGSDAGSAAPQGQGQFTPQQMAEARARYSMGDEQGAMDALYPSGDAVNWQTVTTDEGVFQINPRSPGEMVRIGDRPERNEGEGRDFMQSTKLRVEFQKQNEAFSARRQSYSSILEASKDATGASDLALVYSYMKMLDPGSTVMMGEYANAENTAGVPDQIRALFNKLQTGGKLGEAGAPQRADFVRQAGRLYNTALSQYEASRKEYEGLSTRQGIDPSNVAIDLTYGVERPDISDTPTIPPDAIAELRANPDGASVREFNEIFGPGAAENVLGFQ